MGACVIWFSHTQAICCFCWSLYFTYTILQLDLFSSNNFFIVLILYYHHQYICPLQDTGLSQTVPCISLYLTLFLTICCWQVIKYYVSILLAVNLSVFWLLLAIRLPSFLYIYQFAMWCAQSHFIKAVDWIMLVAFVFVSLIHVFLLWSFRFIPNYIHSIFLWASLLFYMLRSLFPQYNNNISFTYRVESKSSLNWWYIHNEECSLLKILLEPFFRKFLLSHCILDNVLWIRKFPFNFIFSCGYRQKSAGAMSGE